MTYPNPPQGGNCARTSKGDFRCREGNFALNNIKTTNHHEIITRSPEQTRALGQRLGQRLDKGMVLGLNGDLGSGKTCFVQGLARGLEVSEVYDITSPTYTLINEYPGRLPLYHVDLYRLGGHVDSGDLGLDEIFYDGGVVAVEWADRLAPRDWPPTYLDLVFTIEPDDSRRIRINAYGLADDNLLKELFG